jgi:hypothetical protein
MNPSANSNEQQGDPSWPTENWPTLDQASSQYSSANRLEWEWDPMILAQHPGSGGSADGGDGDRMLKNQISAGTLSSLRASYNNISMLSAGLPSNFTNNHMAIFSSAGIRNFGSLDGSAQLSSSSNLHNVLGPSGIPGLAATSGAGLDNDIRSYDQRQRELFAAGMQDRHVKREEVFDGHARIGLNLGVRTYFSTEETAANRLGKRHRAGSPGSQVPMCQAEGCKADLSTAKQYHRRHKVCDLHSKAPNVVAGGQTQRFCQQCSRFHSLGEFDDVKRSCRKRLADHNRRRRKPQPNASTAGGTTAESIGIKSGDEDPSESKSMLMPLKNRSSPSSVSLEDSDEKPSSVGNNLQLRSSGQGFGRGFGDDQNHSPHSGMQMSSQAMTGSDAQALLSAMTPVPLMLPSAKRQMTMMGGSSNHGQDHSVYQQHLEAVQVRCDICFILQISDAVELSLYAVELITGAILCLSSVWCKCKHEWLDSKETIGVTVYMCTHYMSRSLDKQCRFLVFVP